MIKLNLKHKWIQSSRMLLFFFMIFNIISAQIVEVDVNVNIKHSVEGVSDFGRERHMTVHSTPTENDWIGEEDKLDYLINDLDVYFGRDNGSATWKFQDTPEDPLRPSKPDVSAMKLRGEVLKDLYDKKNLLHQYQNKGAMIMGINPHPVYPTLNWTDRGKTWHGWQPYTVETSAEWVVEYLDNYFKKNPGEPGEPMPTYWEVINEPDMEMMTGAMYCTSQEKLWEFHNLVAIGLKERLGDKAPQIGGMTWGLHDFYLKDGISRVPDDRYDQWLTEESLPVYHAMIDSEVNDYRLDAWYQWDIMWQGFIDNCGENMDFYGIHIYDWPGETSNKGVVRSGGHVEAMLDMLEWYDNYKFGAKKDIVLSEFGSVSAKLDEFTPERRAWENLVPFNAMFMQFLERPSHLVLTMPFAPVKAEWGDTKDAEGNVTRRYPSTLLDKDANGNWQWTDFVLFYELWKDVKGTRIDTKSNQLDVQVDSYVDGNHLYLILNNLKETSQNIKLNFFDDYLNIVKEVKIDHLFFNPNLGVDGEAVMDTKVLKTAPGSITLAGDGTIVLNYLFENPVTIDQTSDEKKYMGDILESGTTSIGGVKFRKTVPGRTALVTQVNNVVVPSGAGEAVLRIGGKFAENGMAPTSITINGNELTYTNDWRGETEDSRNVWFGVFEVDVPLEYLQVNNTVTCTIQGNQAEYTTVMLQVFDFSKSPKRSMNTEEISVASIAIEETPFSLMNGGSKALKSVISPVNATNKKIIWTSSDSDIVKVDEFGEVTALSNSGEATITATSDDGGYTSNVLISAIPFEETAVSGIEIIEGTAKEIPYYSTVKLNAQTLPLNATTQLIEWSSSNSDIVEVDSETGKVVGKVIGGSAIISAKLIDVSNNNVEHTKDITVTVGIKGDESIYSSALPDKLRGDLSYVLDVAVNIDGEREIIIEIMKGESTVIGTGSLLVNEKGFVNKQIEISMSSLPEPGLDYKYRAILKKGASIIDENESPLEMLDVIRVESIGILEGEVKVVVDGTLQLYTEVLPLNAFNKTVLWSSTNESVAKVDSEGLVTGVAAGSSVIKAITEDGSFEAEVTIEVETTEIVTEPVSFSIVNSASVFPLGTYAYSLVIEKPWTTEREVEWMSSNTLIATVDANGVVTAGPITGSCTITVTSTSSPSVFASSEFVVSNSIIVEAEDYDSMGGVVGDVSNTSGVIANVQKGDFVTYDVVIPKTGDYSVEFFAATAVDDGQIELLVNGVSKGEVQVTNLGWDSYHKLDFTNSLYLTEGSYTFRLNASGTSAWQWNLDYFKLNYASSTDVEGVVVSPAEVTLKSNDLVNLKAIVFPETASNKSVVWSSSDNAIATVDSNGVVTAHAEGSIEIKATTVEGGFNGVCNLTVNNNFIVLVERIEVNLNDIQLSKTETEQLSIEVFPINAQNKNVSWTSSNESVATVSDSGLVTAVNNGTAIISVISDDGSDVMSKVNVVVSSSIILEAEDHDRTGGTYNDGNVPFGVNVAETLINWVNSGDWIEFDLNVDNSGEYGIYYSISTPANNAEIQILVDNEVVSTDVVPNNQSWDDFQVQEASSLMSLSEGSHVVKVVASGTNAWQWNLDKIELRLAGMLNTSTFEQQMSDLYIYPNPAIDKLTISGSSSKDYTVKIIEINGVYNTSKTIHGLPYTMDVKDLLPGIYFISVSNESTNKILKFVKK